MRAAVVTRPRSLPHAVYHIYGPGDVILYIGVTKDPRARLAVHKSKNKLTWWPYVQRVEINWYPEWREAVIVETGELRTYRPICNPVIPAENGKHATMTRGRMPVRSLWAETKDIADGHGETMIAVIEEGLRRYIKRHGQP